MAVVIQDGRRFFLFFYAESEQMDIDSKVSEARTAIQSAADEQALDEVRVRFLGKKGELTALLKRSEERRGWKEG
mgnify:CR=1 FL=1